MVTNRSNNNAAVVGVFLDNEMAQRAVQQLQSAGIQADIIDKSGLQAIKNSGFDAEAIRIFESRLSEGNVLVATRAGNQGTEALDAMMAAGAEYIDLNKSGQSGTDYANLPAQQRQYGRYDEKAGRAQNAEDLRVQLREETLTPVKQAQQSGEVQLHKVVHEKQQEVPVTLTHEEVVIDRNPVNRAVAPGEMDDFKDEVISVPVYEEQAQLQKQARVREEVGIKKQGVQEEQTLTGTARHEHLEVEQSGNARVQGDTESRIVQDQSQSDSEQLGGR